MAASTEAARYVIDNGFLGTTQTFKTVDHGPDLPAEDVPESMICIFRDRLSDWGDPELGDFVLSIDIPDELAIENLATEDEIAEMLDPVTDDLIGLSELNAPGPPGSGARPPREIWLTPKVANQYLGSLRVSQRTARRLDLIDWASRRGSSANYLARRLGPVTSPSARTSAQKTVSDSAGHRFEAA